MTFYRGADLQSLNSDEFLDNAIDGEELLVVDAEFPETESAENYRNQALYNVGEFITNTREVPITGGLTGTLPAAIKFTKTRFPPGLVLVMDETNIPADVEAIQYAPDWFDAHPGVLAHVTTLYGGELREDGKITALLSMRDDKSVIFETRRSQIENEGTANRVTTERELVAFGPEIWLDDAITNIVIYRGTTGTSPYTLTGTIGEIPGYSVGIGGVKDRQTRERVAGEEDYRGQAEVVYEETKPMIQYDTKNLMLVAVDSMNDIRAEDGRIEPDNFRFVYNGRGFDDNYSRNSHLLGV